MNTEDKEREAYWDDLILGIEVDIDIELDEPTPAIENERDVDQMLRLRTRAAREIDLIHERFDDEIDRLTRLRADLLSGEEKRVAWIDQSLEGFALDMRDSGRKSITLPHGKISTRASTRIEVEDDDATIEWLRDNAPELIKTKESIDRAGLKKMLAEASPHWATNAGATITEVVSFKVEN